MRSRFPILAFFLVASVVVLPHFAHAGGVPFFGPIIPPAYAQCPGGWGLLVIVINNIVSILLTLAIVFVAPFMIAYAGFLYVVNPVNPSGKQKAKDVLTNTIVGIIIALSAWLLVDAIMAVLYDQNTWGTTWVNLISPGTGNECLSQAGTSTTGLNQADQSTSGSGATVTSVPAPSSVISPGGGSFGGAGATGSP